MYALLALLPIFAALFLMSKFKVSPPVSLLLALAGTAVLGCGVWGMRVLYVTEVSLLGVLKSLDIILIIYGAESRRIIFTFNELFNIYFNFVILCICYNICSPFFYFSSIFCYLCPCRNRNKIWILFLFKCNIFISSYCIIIVNIS